MDLMVIIGIVLMSTIMVLDLYWQNWWDVIKSWESIEIIFNFAETPKTH